MLSFSSQIVLLRRWSTISARSRFHYERLQAQVPLQEERQNAMYTVM